LQEDKDEIINAMRSETKSLGLIDTSENCWAVFIQKVKTNLHMVFTASPVGENFRVRSQRFLATVTSTVIDWFQPWPEASLFSVAKKFLDEIDLGEDALRSAVVEFMPYSFALVNKVSKSECCGGSNVLRQCLADERGLFLGRGDTFWAGMNMMLQAGAVIVITVHDSTSWPVCTWSVNQRHV
jgi:hypothetical protein